MTKNLLNVAGRLKLFVTIKSKSLTSDEIGYSYSPDVENNFGIMIRKALFNAFSVHLTKQQISIKKIFDYESVFNDNIEKYVITDFDIDYSGDVITKRVNRNHHYYIVAIDKNSGEIIDERRWKNNNISPDDYIEFKEDGDEYDFNPTGENE